MLLMVLQMVLLPANIDVRCAVMVLLTVLLAMLRMVLHVEAACSGLMNQPPPCSHLLLVLSYGHAGVMPIAD